jgi:hypothetical protein
VALLIPVMAVPMVLLGALVAHAQEAQSMDVIVADFDNRSGYGGEDLAQIATDATAVELSNSGRFSAISRQQVMQAARDLGMRVPSGTGQRMAFNDVELLRIAKQLNAAGVVRGSLQNASAGKGGHNVQIGLLVTIRETASQEIINGGAAFGRALARPGDEEEGSLFNEAIQNAAAEVVRHVVQRALLAATVLNIEPGVVVLNRGLRDGYHVGDDVVILRRDAVTGQLTEVGKVKIARSYGTDCEADIESNTGGIRPEDVGRVLFSPPQLQQGQFIQASGKANHVSLSSIGSAISAILIGVVLAEAQRGGTASVTNVRAEATTYSNAAAVRVTWGDNIFGLAGVQQYHIWRLPDRPFSVALSTNSTSSSSTSTSGTSTTVVILPVGCASNLTHIFIDQVEPFAFYLNGFDFIFGTGGNGGPTSTGGSSSNSGTSGTGGTGSGTSSSGVSCGFDVEFTPAVTGFKAGSSYQYQVSATVLIQVNQSGSTSSGTGGTGTSGTGTSGTGTSGSNTNSGLFNCVESDPVTSGLTTPVTPVLLLSPANQAANVNLQSFNPTWGSTAGADEFQVEVSLDRTFKTVSQIYRIGPIFSTAPNSTNVTQTLPTGTPNDLTVRPELLANSLFANFVNGTSTTSPTLYWRVGARNSTDVPGPIDWITNSASDADTNWRWVYPGTPYSFTGATLPPPPPSKAAKRTVTVPAAKATTATTKAVKTTTRTSPLKTIKTRSALDQLLGTRKLFR